MSTKKIVLLSVLFLLFTSLVFADNYQAYASAINDKIEINEEAEFNITIKNNLNRTEEFRIRNLDFPVWDVRTVPLLNPFIITVPPESQSTFTVFVRSLNPSITPIGTYSVKARITKDNTDEFSDIPLTVAIKSTRALINGYIPNVKSAIIMPDKIDPRNPTELKISLKNLNPIDYEGMKVKLTSNLINEELNTDLGPASDNAFANPDSEKSLMLTKEFDPFTKPQKDTLFLEVSFENRVIDTQVIEYEIEEYVDQKEVTKQNLILKSISKIEIETNNQDYSGKLKLEAPIFGKLFTSTNPKAELITEGEKLFYVWDLNLDGKNSIEVTSIVNFRPLFILIFVFLIAVGLYFLFRSPIVVRKEVVRIHKMQGGISHLKVLIKVKNRGRKEIDNVGIEDKIPAIAELQKDVSVGSLKPINLTQRGHNIIIKWRLEKLVQGDERVLAYNFRSRLPIVGEYSLASVSANFQYGKRHFVSNSNRAIVGS